MGLDIVLALMILTSAVRGWLRGFLIQAIRLAGLIGCVYTAAPVRDLARPYVAENFTTIRSDLLDRIVWWSSAVVVYIVSVGVASLVVKMQRRRPFVEIEPNRTDQFAGFLLGGIKGTLVVAFLVSALQEYALPRVKGIDWAEEQSNGSLALKWNDDYHPARQVWNSTPVQHFVTEVKRMGIPPSTSGNADPTARLDSQPVQATHADRPPRLDLDLPQAVAVDPESPDFKQKLNRILDELAPKPPAQD